MTSPSDTQPRASYRPDRLARAWLLVKGGNVERLGNGHFRVAGNVEPAYDVDLHGDPMCYCRDMENRERAIKGNCKHVLASRLANMDPSLLQVIGEKIEKEMEENEKLTRRSRRRRTPADTEGGDGND